MPAERESCWHGLCNVVRAGCHRPHSPQTSARRVYVLVLEVMTQPLPKIAATENLGDQALELLLSRAARRGDHMLARDLAAVSPRSEEESSVLMQVDCPALARIAAICDPIETLAWRRALVDATVRGDRRRACALLDLADRRCAN